MAIAFSAITDITEQRAPANPVAAKGNVAYTRSVKVVVPASTTAAALPLGLFLPPGTQVVAASLDTDTSFGTSTLALSTATSTFVAAKVLTVTGGEQCTIAANKGVVVPSSATADSEVSLTLATASSPASEVTVVVNLVCVGISIDAGPTTFTS